MSDPCIVNHAMSRAGTPQYCKRLPDILQLVCLCNAESICGVFRVDTAKRRLDRCHLK